MKKLIILLLSSGILHSIAYSQTDSLRCFTVSQQNELITKLVHRLELINENSRLIRLDKKNDSIIAIQNSTISDLTSEKDLLVLAHENKKKAYESERNKAEKEAKRKRFWRGSTITVGIVGILLYILK